METFLGIMIPFGNSTIFGLRVLYEKITAFRCSAPLRALPPG